MQDEMSLEYLLKEGAKQFNVELEDNQIEAFFKYKDTLKEWNNKINLTAIEEDREIIVKHFIDSLSILPYIKNEKIDVIDVGTGAGFPGIPVKIALNSVNVTLLDSLAKRIRFLNEVIKQLNLNVINTIHGRAEDFGANVQFREKFDIAVARAVASLPVLLEYCLPFVKVGGVFIAMKGSSLEEVSNSNKALEVLGGEIQEVKEIVLPFSDAKRNIIIIKKFRHTLTKYPRKAGKPSRDPLT
jgi:16S rRNA (guanine527-N7)-methyltransferase